MSAEEAAERAESCNVPLQVGVGLAGGAEVAIQLLREHLRRHPSHAIAWGQPGKATARPQQQHTNTAAGDRSAETASA